MRRLFRYYLPATHRRRFVGCSHRNPQDGADISIDALAEKIAADILESYN